jgi:hypothetical protein
LVSSYTAGNNVTADAVAKLWVNPVVSATEPTPTITSTIDTAPRVSINKVYFVQSGADDDIVDRTPTIILDELRIANTWAEVVSTTDTATLGIDQNEISNFGIYPNPANDYITVESNQAKVSSIDMFNALGAKVLANEQLTNNRLDVSN